MTVFRFFLALVIGTASGLTLPQARVTAATHNPMLSGQCCPPPAATPSDSLQASSLQLSSVGVHSQVPACRGVTSAKMPAARFSLYMSETLPEPSEAAQPVAETATPATMPPAAPKQADVWSSMASQATRVGCNTGGVASLLAGSCGHTPSTDRILCRPKSMDSHACPFSHRACVCH